MANFRDERFFKVHNYRFFIEPEDLILECLAVLIGEYSILRKQAALIILKILLAGSLLKSVLSESNAEVFDRNDFRVNIWKEKVLSAGECDICGSKANLEAHHRMLWSEYPQGRIDPNNGQCLCHNCHTEEHKNNTAYYMMIAKCV